MVDEFVDDQQRVKEGRAWRHIAVGDSEQRLARIPWLARSSDSTSVFPMAVQGRRHPWVVGAKAGSSRAGLALRMETTSRLDTTSRHDKLDEVSPSHFNRSVMTPWVV
jgi:hypothetical protein